MSAVIIDDRDAMYGTLMPHFLRIGDTQFYVPPSAVSVTKRYESEQIKMMRSKNNFIKNNGFYEKIVDLSIFFADMVSINNELRPLLAQAKKCPFLPIENTLLNETYRIDAIVVKNITVQTAPGFPHGMICSIQAYAFEWDSYVQEDSNRTFSEMINWPLFRWYYQLNLLKGNRFTYYEPLDQLLNHQFSFSTANEDDLKRIRNWKKTKNKIIAGWLKDQKDKPFFDREDDLLTPFDDEDRVFSDEEIKQGYQEYDHYFDDLDRLTFEENIKLLYDQELRPYNVGMEPWNMERVTLKDLIVSHNNTITSVKLQDFSTPNYQYLGANDVSIKARFHVEGSDALSNVEDLMDYTNYLTREYHKEMTSGFLSFEHPITKMFGIRHVGIMDYRSSTIDGIPELYEVEVTMLAYNRSEQKMLETKKIYNPDATWDINMMENSGLMGAMGLLGLVPFALTLNPAFLVPALGWLSERPFAKHLFEDNLFTDDVKKKAIYDQKIMESFSIMEMYPDLELPTYEEVKQAGFDIPNLNNGYFVDPDFFILYENPFGYRDQLNEALGYPLNVRLRDRIGGKATLENGLLNPDENTKAFAAKTKSELQSSIPRFTGIKDMQSDQQLSISQREALIRQKTKAFRLGKSSVFMEHLPLALAKAFDPKLRQYYELGSNQNRELNHVQVNEQIPILMSKNMQYFADPALIRNAAYIGVMRVSPLMSDPNLLGFQIESNIEVGLSALYYYYEKAKDAVYDVEKIAKRFQFTSNQTELVKNIYTVMHYLNLEREFEWLSTSKKINQHVMQLISKIIQIAQQEQSWSEGDLTAQLASIPVSDYKSIEEMAYGSLKDAAKIETSGKTEDDFVDAEARYKSMFHDMLHYDKRNRLLRAFPTFFLTFVDEGQYFGTVKMSDQFFGYQAVNDITYMNSRKSAASTLYLELNNVFGNLSDATKGMDYSNNHFFNMVAYLFLPGLLAKSEDTLSRNRTPNWYRSIYLKTGARVHFRMGYGSNAAELPILINGAITSIQNNGETLSVIVQDDGIELTNKLKVDADETTEGFLFSQKEPTEIVDELLRDDRGFWGNLYAAFSSEEYKFHSLGIMHFGEPGTPFNNTFEADRIITEINMNVYETTGKLNTEKGFWASFADTFGFSDYDEDSININLYDKTIWDVLNICASVGEDMVVAVHPFHFRNTIFVGKPQMPIKYGYLLDDAGDVTLNFRMKTFRQMHFYDSINHIIDNSIVATEENMYTVAVGTYYSDGELETTDPIYVDTDIWPEKQRTVFVDTSLNAKGIALLDYIPIVGGMLNAPFKWYFDESIAIKMTAHALKDYVKEMYNGYLTVLGDPSVKPYDQIIFQDTHNGMSGPMEVREVTQIMNAQTGFITMINPDCIVVNYDKDQVHYLVQAANIGALIVGTVLLRRYLRMKGYQGKHPLLSFLYGLGKDGIDRLKNMKSAKAISSFFQEMELTQYLKSKGAGWFSRKNASTTPSEETIKKAQKSGKLDELIQFAEQYNLEKASNGFDQARDRMYGQKILGYNKIDMNRIKGLRTWFTYGATGSVKTIGAIAKTLRWGGRAAVASTGIGIVPVLIEMFVTEIVFASVAELIERFLFTRQACMIVPIKKSGMLYTAGINGHRGSVVGDCPDGIQTLFTNWFSTAALALIGADVSKYADQYDQSQLDAFDTYADSTDHIDVQAMIQEYASEVEVYVPFDAAYKAHYQKRVSQFRKDMKAKSEEVRFKNEQTYAPTESNSSRSIGVPTNASSYLTVDLNVPSGISAEAINRAFANTGLAGLGSYFKQVEQAIPGSNGQNLGTINGLYLAAHAAWETGWGSSRIFRDKNNLFGYGAVDSNPYEGAYRFDSKQACIVYAAGKIKTNYLTPGGKFYRGPTLTGMNVLYATDQNWKNGIAKIMAKIASFDAQFISKVANASGSSSELVPSMIGAAGKQKYIVHPDEMQNKLVKISGGPFLSVLASPAYLRPESAKRLAQLAHLYGQQLKKSLVVTSCYRAFDMDSWHCTGFGFDLDTPDCGKIAGEYRFAKGSKEKKELEQLIDLCVSVGFSGIIHADADVISAMSKKYPHVLFQQRNDHFNHLHISYPK